MSGTVLILGASGRSGNHAAKAFAADGWNVRRFDRERDDIIEAAKGADVIFNGMNPPNYENWAENIPRITHDAIRAAKASGATIIQPGTVYVYGNRPGLMSEDTPQSPHTVKGRIRVEMEQTYRQAARDGVQVILLRAGDFIDPEDGGDAMSIIYLRALAKGRLTTGGDPGVTRPYAYMPDFARAAVMLANIRDQLGRYEDIPFDGHNFSVLELKAEVERQVGYDLKLAHFPWWLIQGLSPFWRLGRELLEMRYLWSLDHRLDGTKMAPLLPDFERTTLEEVVARSIAARNGKTVAAVPDVSLPSVNAEGARLS